MSDPDAESAAKVLQAFIDSDDGKHHFDVISLQNSRLAVLLARIATTYARKDGWTLLSIAGDQLVSSIPEEFNRLKKAYGEGSLRKLIMAIDLFDVRTEDTPNGGTRSVYRARP